MPEKPKKRIVKSAAPVKSGRSKKSTAKPAADTEKIVERVSAHIPVPTITPAVSAASEQQQSEDTGELPGAEPVWPAHPSGRDRYFEAVGRRKTAIARVRLFTRSGPFTVNDKAYGDYFPTLDLQKITEDALKKMKLWERFRVSVHVSGGGIHAQAEAVRHGLARCLIGFNPDFRKRMKRAGFLKRDPRMKERKKFGLKKARRAPQWAKR